MIMTMYIYSQKVLQSGSTHAQGPDLHLDDVVMADRDGHGRFGNMTLKKDGLLTAEGQNIYVICLSPDGKYLALGDDEGGLEVSTYANLDHDHGRSN